MHVFQDNVVIVTGASMGIGEQIAYQLADQKARLVLAACSAENLSDIAARCEAKGAKATVVPVDLDEAQCKTLIAHTVETYGRIDTLLYNAGRAFSVPFAEIPNLDSIRTEMNLNFFGLAACVHYALPHLPEEQLEDDAMSTRDIGSPAANSADSANAYTGTDASDVSARVRRVLPFAQRRMDWPVVFFFLLNLLLVTYIVDLEQLAIPDPAHFTYPVWPPAFMIDSVHYYGYSSDPLLIARPVWWKATIWIDVLRFGQFYVFGIYAFVKGKSWIKVPMLVYSGMMLLNVIIILFEEAYGPSATPQFGKVWLLNTPWLLVHLYLIYRAIRPGALFAEADSA